MNRLGPRILVDVDSYCYSISSTSMFIACRSTWISKLDGLELEQKIQVLHKVIKNDNDVASATALLKRILDEKYLL